MYLPSSNDLHIIAGRTPGSHVGHFPIPIFIFWLPCFPKKDLKFWIRFIFSPDHGVGNFIFFTLLLHFQERIAWNPFLIVHPAIMSRYYSKTIMLFSFSYFSFEWTISSRMIHSLSVIESCVADPKSCVLCHTEGGWTPQQQQHNLPHLTTAFLLTPEAQLSISRSFQSMRWFGKLCRCGVHQF